MLPIGEKIKKLRELRNYTQDYVAKRLKITQAGYSKIESGQTDITYSKVSEIAKVLDISVEDLVGFDSQRYFHSFNNVKGNNNGNVMIDIKTEEIKLLYESKIKLLNKLLSKTEEELEKYQNRFGNL